MASNSSSVGVAGSVRVWGSRDTEDAEVDDVAFPGAPVPDFLPDTPDDTGARADVSISALLSNIKRGPTGTSSPQRPSPGAPECATGPSLYRVPVPRLTDRTVSARQRREGREMTAIIFFRNRAGNGVSGARSVVRACAPRVTGGKRGYVRVCVCVCVRRGGSSRAGGRRVLCLRCAASSPCCRPRRRPPRRRTRRQRRRTRQRRA